MNALSFSDGHRLRGADNYCLFRPCRHCAKQIINAGIKRVIYAFEYDADHWVPDYMRERGIELVHMKGYEPIFPGTKLIAEFLTDRGEKYDGDSNGG